MRQIRAYTSKRAKRDIQLPAGLGEFGAKLVGFGIPLFRCLKRSFGLASHTNVIASKLVDKSGAVGGIGRQFYDRPPVFTGNRDSFFGLLESPVYVKQCLSIFELQAKLAIHILPVWRTIGVISQIDYADLCAVDCGLYHGRAFSSDEANRTRTGAGSSPNIAVSSHAL